MEGLSVALVMIAVIGFFAFRQWIQHHRRVLIHRERIAAIEKGVDLPTLDHEVKRSSWNVQRIILLMGLIWISLGIGAFIVFSVMDAKMPDFPHGLQFIGIAPIGIGISHLIVYRVGARREDRP
jgi:hypothetical protein